MEPQQHTTYKSFIKSITLKQLLPIITLAFFSGLTNLFGQAIPDSVYNSWWANKDRSIFKMVNNGSFSGTTYGYIQLKNNKDTIVLDFQSTKTILNIFHDSAEIYDNSSKKYSTQTTSAKTTLTYEIYALANILTLNLNGSRYSIGSIDGASDTPIPGLTFNYCSEKDIEYLTLYVTKSLQLTTTIEIMQQKKVNYLDARKAAKSITIFPGSTIILTVKK
jgi:hypothetical protein